MTLDKIDSPPETPTGAGPENHTREAGPRSWVLDDVIRAHVKHCLVYFGGDVVKAAAALRVGKTTLYRWLKKWMTR
jgi:transcriptional regulator with PAS, ATPase and Fis domain